MPSAVVVVGGILVPALIAHYAGPTIWSMLTTPLRDLPGPPSASLIWGNLKLLADEEGLNVQEQWATQYGPTIAFKSFLGVRSFVYIYACPYDSMRLDVAPLDSRHQV